MRVYIIKEYLSGSYEGVYNICDVVNNEEKALEYCNRSTNYDYEEWKVEINES